MYNREKRRFAKLILDQYKKLGRPEGSTRYSKEYRRLRDYAEALFLGIRQKRASIVREQDIYLAMSTLDIPMEHKPQMDYVAELAIGAISNKLPTDFVGNFACGNCGGEYQQTDVYGRLGYRCSTCNCEGRADQHGFPISLPANANVRSLRRIFHQNIRVIIDHGVMPEEAYMLVAYEIDIPLPSVHAGLCVSEKDIHKLVEASNNILSKLMLERAA